MVNLTPASASTSSVSSSAAVSGSHMPSGLPPEPQPEVFQPPLHLGDLVGPGGERHDHVVVDLGDGVAVSAARGDAGAVGLHDLGVHDRRLAGQPGEQRGPDVERDALEVVHDVDDAVGRVDPAGGGVRRVALGGDARVPVVVGRGRVLDLDGLEPGVLARRLVEVAVDDDRAGGGHAETLRTPPARAGTPGGRLGARRRSPKGPRSAAAGRWPGPRQSRCRPG